MENKINNIVQELEYLKLKSYSFMTKKQLRQQLRHLIKYVKSDNKTIKRVL